MRLILQRTSLVLFSIVALFLVWFGLTYGMAQEMLSFHAAALPEEVRGAAKPLYLALMHLIGAASLAFGLAGLYVIVFPLRRGLPGAAISRNSRSRRWRMTPMICALGTRVGSAMPSSVIGGTSTAS